tara:strand:- start:3174 stop:3575 length:402 start_codon:yes stop_codon:yes gene_type:complete
MATVNVKYTRSQGRNAFTSFHTIWDSTANHAAVTVVDLSADADAGHTNSITIQKVKILCTAGIDAQLLFDAGSDEPFINTILGSTAWLDVDFRDNGLDGLTATASAATGDLLVTTTSAASADEMLILVWWRSN